MLLTDKSVDRKKTLLIIDDEDLNFFSLAAMLKSKGYACLSANGTGEALTVLRTTPEMDAILMDIMMPGLDGFETTRLIKEEPPFDSIPIIALTALTTNDVKEKALASGAVAFLTKPVDVDLLLAKLEELIAD